jgi:ubiquinone biosynthesis protein
VLLNLFNTARRFNMEVQPQLVLLQKTLLYVEGVGRQLYPQLDLWKTAKPFLESWIKDQVGIPALVRAFKEKAPFWIERMPEIPELVYDSLRRASSCSTAWIPSPASFSPPCSPGPVPLSVWYRRGFAAEWYAAADQPPGVGMMPGWLMAAGSLSGLSAGEKRAEASLSTGRIRIMRPE